MNDECILLCRRLGDTIVGMDAEYGKELGSSR